MIFDWIYTLWLSGVGVCLCGVAFVCLWYVYVMNMVFFSVFMWYECIMDMVSFLCLFGKYACVVYVWCACEMCVFYLCVWWVYRVYRVCGLLCLCVLCLEDVLCL